MWSAYSPSNSSMPPKRSISVARSRVRPPSKASTPPIAKSCPSSSKTKSCFPTSPAPSNSCSNANPIKNIGILAGIERHARPCLRGKEMAQFETLENAYLLIEDDRIADFGRMEDEEKNLSLDSCHLSLDAEGGTLLPSFCDSHTHLVFAGSREGEFVDKLRGLSYAEIARRGGGILNSADRLHATSEDELLRQALTRIDEIIAKGTGCVEIKSGYGLNLDDELKMLRVIRRIAQERPLCVRSTFLGAHAVPRNMSREAYVSQIVDEMLPEVGRQQLADFIDVFCEEGFFTPADTDRLLEAGAKWGLRPKIHAEQLAASGGVAVAVKHGALSVDHLESMPADEIALFDGAPTIPTVLPGASFFLNMRHAPARQMIDAGLPLALASDFNPGSTPSGDMRFVVSLACIALRMLPAEAFNAATLNAACAMGLSRDYGSIAVGKKANFYITRPIPSIDYIPYAYTTPLIRRVFLDGKEIA